MENIDKYFEKNLDKESYDFLLQLEENGKYTWQGIGKKTNIEDKKIVWKGNLYIEGTKVKKIKAKRIEGSVDTYSVESLEEIEVEEEILGDLDIRGTKQDFQLKVIEKIRNGELKVKGEVCDNI